MRLGLRVLLAVGVLLAARPATAAPPADAVDVEACADDTPLPTLLIGFAARDPSALDALLREQLDPGSPRYHAWLTPDEYGVRFGAPADDYAAAVRWLGARGFSVVRTWPGASAIAFRGNAGQVRTAFRTRLHHFAWRGERRIAPLDAPVLPSFGATRAAVLLGIDDFARVHRELHVGAAGNRLAPADVQRVFGLDALQAAGQTGRGTTIGILAVADFATADVDLFRSSFGLPPVTLTKRMLEGPAASTDPGDALEALIDTEWPGAVAPEAAIVAQIGGTAATSALLQAWIDVVNANQADVLSISFGACESDVGSATLQQIDGLARQAAAQGQTILVASGDKGPADCLAGNPSATGQAVNGLASSPFVTAVGGTTLDPRFDAGGNATDYGGEVVWNEAGSFGASGGGRSAFFTKPVWQVGPGVPADGARDLPDVAFAASVESPGYLVVDRDGSCEVVAPFCAVGGTSIAAPIWAGFAALLVQAHRRLGLLNPELYRLGRLQAGGGAATFHDVVSGSNDLPSTPGFGATPGFDLATGWGSFDGPALAAAYAACTTDAACDDGNACTTDTCNAASGCHNAKITGVPGILCLFADHTVATASCPRVPAAVSARFEEARSLLGRALSATRPGRVRRLVAAAGRKLQRDERLVSRALRQGRIDSDCATSLVSKIQPIRDATLRPP